MATPRGRSFPRHTAMLCPSGHCSVVSHLAQCQDKGFLHIIVWPESREPGLECVLGGLSHYSQSSCALSGCRYDVLVWVSVFAIALWWRMPACQIALETDILQGGELAARNKMPAILLPRSRCKIMRPGCPDGTLLTENQCERYVAAKYSTFDGGDAIDTAIKS